jgi:hypothetical protein
MTTMTTRRMWMAITGALALTLVAGAGKAGAGEKKAKTASYIVIAPHTEAGCLDALDHVAQAKKLDRFEFGCAHGDHTGYTRVNAASPEEALAIVPEQERGAARAVQLDKFTPEQLAAIHASKK